MSDPEQQPLLQDVNANPDLESATASETPQKSLRAKTRAVLDSNAFHKFMIALIILDSTCVLADLSYTFLSPTCTPIEGPSTPLWLNILAQISLAVTTFFLLEIPVTLWAFGFEHYNPFGPVPHATLHLFDAIIIVTTFVLEVVLRGKERELASLLIILRLWRLVKLVGGIAVGAGEVEEETTKELEDTKRKLTEALSSVSQLREENSSLRARIFQLGGPVD